MKLATIKGLTERTGLTRDQVKNRLARRREAGMIRPALVIPKKGEPLMFWDEDEAVRVMNKTLRSLRNEKRS